MIEIDYKNGMVNLCHLARTKTLDEALQLGCQLALNVFSARRCVIFMFDYSGHNLNIRGFKDNGDVFWAPPPYSFDISSDGECTSPLDHVALTGRSLTLNETPQGNDFNRLDEVIGYPRKGTSLAFAPLREAADMPPVGIIALCRSTRFANNWPHAECCAVLNAIAAQLSRHLEFRRVIEQSDILERQTQLKQTQSKGIRTHFEDRISLLFPGKSKIVLKLRRDLMEQAHRETPLLLIGSRGMRKEQAAQAIHDSSRYYNGKFTYVDCARYSNETLLSELFGVRRGAISGQNYSRRGFVGEASGGTLYLNRIERIPFNIQDALYRFLETRLYRPIGADRDKQFSGRVILGTNAKIQDERIADKLDPRLIACLSANRIEFPQLQDIKEDLPLIIETLLAQYTETSGRRFGLSQRAMAGLLRMPFPGQLAQLDLCLRYAVEHLKPTENTVCVHHIYRALGNEDVNRQNSDEVFNLRDEIEAFEASIIRRALELEDWNRTQAAKRLNLPKRTLADKCKKYML